MMELVCEERWFPDYGYALPIFLVQATALQVSRIEVENDHFVPADNALAFFLPCHDSGAKQTHVPQIIQAI
jgi:hypothetical protein